MCGIAGVYYWTGTDSAEPARLGRMADAMAHRGPDGRGVWVDGPVGLAHRRLTILDLSGGQQPMHSKRTGAVLTFNGEIYNFLELRHELAEQGFAFAERNDTEVLLAAYDAYGERCVEKLRGMFAFAIWDPSRRRLFAARDRLGIKPLYYASTARLLCFASELKAFAALPEVPRALDLCSVEQYLLRQYVPGPATIFEGIRKLPPGHWLSCDASGVRTQAYWQAKPRVPRAALDPRESAAALREALQDSVRRHLVSDVPLGAFLSGGIDSSLIVGLMAREASRPVKTYSVGFSGPAGYSELDYARQVARWFGTDHHELLIGPDSAESLVEAVVAQMDEPLADYAALPTYAVSRLAASEVKVVLTGEGADELFGGYRRYVTELLAERLRRLVGRSPRLAGSAVRVASRVLPWADAREFAQHALQPAEAYYQPTHLFGAGELGELLGDAAPAARRAPLEPPVLPPAGAADGELLDRLLLADVGSWLPDDLLVKVDSMSMLASLEARVPYLDHELVSFVLSLPASLKVHPWRLRTKVVLKSVASELLPARIVHRRKHGFRPPVDAWLRGGLRERSRDLLLDATAAQRGLLRPESVARLLREHEAGRKRGHKLWSLLVLEGWCRAHGLR